MATHVGSTSEQKSDQQREFKVKPEPIPPRCLRTAAAAEYLGISAWTMRDLVHLGKISYLPGSGGTAGWRFDIKDLDRSVDQTKERQVAL